MLRYACVLSVLLMMAYSLDPPKKLEEKRAQVPNVTLNNGNKMPAIALGTYLGIDQAYILSSKNTVRNAISEAIDAGYRHIDTAAIYDTESSIGEALRIKFQDGGLKREDLFITTKLWNTAHGRSQVPQALRESLNKLGLKYVDLYLMHWPMGLNEDYTYSEADYMETWRGLEDVLESGLTRAIGVSNFNVAQMERLLREARVAPAVLQIEVHPQMLQQELVALCKSHNITVMGYSSLGTAVQRFGMTLPGLKLDSPLLVEIGGHHGKSSAQVLLRWQVNRNIVPVVKSLHADRLRENIDIFDFKLADDEMMQITSNQTYRLIEPSFWQDHKYYPFEKVATPAFNPFLKSN